MGSFQAEFGFNILDSIISGETPSSSASLKVVGIAALGVGGIKLLKLLSSKARKIFKGNKIIGAGPVPNSIEVSRATSSVALFKNFSPKQRVDFVFDPKSKRMLFSTRSSLSQSNKGLGHPHLARAIGANDKTVVGCTFIRSKNGNILTNEKSGHFFENWSSANRKLFVSELKKLSQQAVQHTPGL